MLLCESVLRVSTYRKIMSMSRAPATFQEAYWFFKVSISLLLPLSCLYCFLLTILCRNHPTPEVLSADIHRNFWCRRNPSLHSWNGYPCWHKFYFHSWHRQVLLPWFRLLRWRRTVLLWTWVLLWIDHRVFQFNFWWVVWCSDVWIVFRGVHWVWYVLFFIGF